MVLIHKHAISSFPPSRSVPALSQHIKPHRKRSLSFTRRPPASSSSLTCNCVSIFSYIPLTYTYSDKFSVFLFLFKGGGLLALVIGLYICTDYRSLIDRIRYCDDTITNYCTPCPLNARCINQQLICNEGYFQQGLNCIESNMLNKEAVLYIQSIQSSFKQKSIDHYINTYTILQYSVDYLLNDLSLRPDLEIRIKHLIIKKNVSFLTIHITDLSVYISYSPEYYDFTIYQYLIYYKFNLIVILTILSCLVMLDRYIRHSRFNALCEELHLSIVKHRQYCSICTESSLEEMISIYLSTSYHGYSPSKLYKIFN